MNKHLTSLSVLTVFLSSFLLTVGCDAEPTSVAVSFKSPTGVSSPQIRVELATTPQARQLGLMFRKTLPEQTGMLFYFPDIEARSFWMKNTYLELDMIFVDGASEVRCIVHRATPLTETPRACPEPTRYVVEIGGGQAEAMGIAEGSMMQIQGRLPEPE